MIIYLHTRFHKACQDLSLAGKRGGMKDTSTRSGLLWEVERILNECENLPQILIMENVPQVHGKGNKEHFQEWIKVLENLGYSSYWQDLNAKNYGIPQNRNRTFMISILGDYNYNFPKKIKLKKRLKDLLESEVDEKYYLSQKMINCFLSDGTNGYPRRERFLGNINRKNQDIGNAVTTLAGCRPSDNYVVEGRLKKEILCDELLNSGSVKEGDVINHSRDESVVEENMSPTLTTRPDELGVVVVDLKRGYPVEVKEEKETSEGIDVIGNYSKSNYNQTPIVGKNGIAPTVTENHGQVTATVVNNDIKPKLIGGIGEKKSNGGTQYYQQDRIYDGESIAMAHPANLPSGSYMYLVKGKLGNDRAVVVNDNNIYNLFFTIFGLCCTIDTKEKDKYERSRELLQILWQEIGKKEIWQEIRRFIGVQEKKILQSNLYENGIYENRKSQSRISSSPSNSEKHNGSITNREKMFNMWEEWKTRYTPQRWELSEQQFRQFNLFMQELSYETAQGETSMQDMWQTNERFRVLQQTLFEIQEIWRPIENKISNGLRIRKLSPLECWRLMGVKDEDYDKIKHNQSQSSLYHLAGDSIVTTVLMAIFGELLNIDYKNKIYDLVETLTKNS